MTHEATFCMLHHVMAAHKDEMFGGLNYVAGHLVVVQSFVAQAMKSGSFTHMEPWTVECAALGHDLLEDHPKYWEEHNSTLIRTIGPHAMNWIREVSDQQHQSRKWRKSQQLKRITVIEGRYSTAALLIKIGDWYSHLMPWGKESMLKPSIEHAEKALKCIDLRLKGHRSAQHEVPVRYAHQALDVAVKEAKAR